MDSREYMHARQAIANFHLAFMQRPSRWPCHPFLPLRREREDGWPEIGLLYDANGKSGTQGYQSTVFLVNLCAVGVQIKSEREFLAKEQIKYDSFVSLYDDGWRVD